MERSLGKTLGISLSQGQLTQMAVDTTGFSGAGANSLCRAMGSKRSVAKTETLHTRFLAGLERTSGIDEDVGEQLWGKIVTFAVYSFLEPHVQSFTSLVYFSAWFKYHYPTEFCVTLLHAQPVGLYSPQLLVTDTRRHNIGCDGPDIALSGVETSVIDGRIRLGLGTIAGMGNNVAERIVAARPFVNATNVARRVQLGVRHMGTLVRAGVLGPLGVNRCQTLWAAGVAATESGGMLPGLTLTDTSTLLGITELELTAANLTATGVIPGQCPAAALREDLQERGVMPATELEAVPDGVRVEAMGIATHRQRLGAADGMTFLGMEDETGLANMLCTPRLWNRLRPVAMNSRAVVVRDTTQTAPGAVTIVADRLVGMSETLGRLMMIG